MDASASTHRPWTGGHANAVLERAQEHLVAPKESCLVRSACIRIEFLCCQVVLWDLIVVDVGGVADDRGRDDRPHAEDLGERGAGCPDPGGELTAGSAGVGIETAPGGGGPPGAGGPGGGGRALPGECRHPQSRCGGGG